MARIAVAMSGGVDSAVAALLLKQQGHELCGVTIATSAASAQEPLRDETVIRAEQACAGLDIPHLRIDFSAQFEADVVADFLACHAAGLTPNPCVICNPALKWGTLLRYVIGEGYKYLATGHYARVRQNDDRYRLLRGVDPDKDQSYMLCRLSQEQLAHTVLPLGEYTKIQVRKLAAEAYLPQAKTPESQDLCFVAAEDYGEFLAERLDLLPGPILNRAGEILGRHGGLALYTVGQRKGLGIAHSEPLFVIRKDAESNTLIVGPREAALKSSCGLGDVNWVSVAAPADGASISGQLEVRYRTRPVPAVLTVTGDQATVRLARPQVCAPGQAGVLYDGDVLVCGGMIEDL